MKTQVSPVIAVIAAIVVVAVIGVVVMMRGKTSAQDVKQTAVRGEESGRAMNEAMNHRRGDPIPLKRPTMR